MANVKRYAAIKPLPSDVIAAHAEIEVIGHIEAAIEMIGKYKLTEAELAQAEDDLDSFMGEC